MEDSNNIYNMLDWNSRHGEQLEGIELGVKMRNIEIFLQPLLPKYN